MSISFGDRDVSGDSFNADIRRGSLDDLAQSPYLFPFDAWTFQDPFIESTPDLTLLSPWNLIIAGTFAVTGATTFTGVATFTAAPVMSALTAALPVFTNGSKALTSNAMTGTGSVVMSVNQTITGTLTAAAANYSGAVGIDGNFDVGNTKFIVAVASGNTIVAGTLGVTGVATFTAQPIMSSLTAALPIFTDGSKGLVSNTMTGSGSVVMSVSPTLTGTIGAASMTLSGTLGVTGVATFTAQPIVSSLTAALAVFTDGSKGLVSNAITGSGNVVMSANPTLTGTVGAASMTLSGTLGVTGVATFTAQPIMSSLTASVAVFTDGSKGLVSNAITGSGSVVMSLDPTLTGTITAAAANFSGAVGVDGNFDVGNTKFTVAVASGDTVVAGTLDVTGAVAVGTDDIALGVVSLYGNGTGSDEGGELRLHTAADYDASYQFYAIDAFQDDLRIRREGVGVDITLTSDGYVGIGLAIPTHPFHLHTASSANVYSHYTNTTTGAAASDGFLVGLNDSEQPIIWNYENTNIRIATNGLDRVTIQNDGKVGIGTSNPSSELDVIGDIEYTGTLINTSDERLKENITDITNALNTITALQGKTFNMLNTTNVKYGLVAQEVQSIMPEAVKVIDIENGYLGVSYLSFIPILIEATKELKAENDQKNAEIQQLKQMIYQTQVEIDSWKGKN